MADAVDLSDLLFPKPTLVLHTDNARQNQEITVRGENFDRFELLVLYFSDEELPTEILPRVFARAEHQADGDGAFSVTMTLPRNLPVGARWIVALRPGQSRGTDRLVAERLFVTKG